MHEFSICERLVEAVLSECDMLAEGQSLKEVRVVVGDFQQIVPESLQLAYEVLTRDTPAHGSTLRIVSKPVVCRCRRCGWEGGLEKTLFLCGACGGTDLEMVSGRELYLESLEVEEYDE